MYQYVGWTYELSESAGGECVVAELKKLEQKYRTMAQIKRDDLSLNIKAKREKQYMHFWGWHSIAYT